MMNTRDINIRVELYEHAIPMRNDLKQGDTTRLIIDVRRGGEPYDLTGLGMLLNVKRHDELVYIQTGGYTVEGSTAVWELEPPIVAESGQIELEFVLTDASGDTVSSFVFRMHVAARLLNGDEDIAPDEQNEIIDAAKAAALSVTQAREAADAAANSASGAANSAVNAAASEAAVKDATERAEMAASGAAASKAAATAAQNSAAQSAASAQSSANAAQTAQKAAEAAKIGAEASALEAKKDADRAENAASAAKSDAAAAQAAKSQVEEYAKNAAASASAAKSSETAAAQSAAGAAKAKTDAESAAKDAEASADRAEAALGNTGWAAMEIGEDGNLYLERSDNLVDMVDFNINSEGELEVIVQ